VKIINTYTFILGAEHFTPQKFILHASSITVDQLSLISQRSVTLHSFSTVVEVIDTFGYGESSLASEGMRWRSKEGIRED